MRLGSLSIIKNCQMHFGRAARNGAAWRGAAHHSRCGTQLEVAWGSSRGTPEGEGDEVDSGLMCTVAQSLASVLLLARILIDFENTIFCANDQNALRCRLLLRPRPDRVMPRSPCVYIISMPLAFAFPFRSASRTIL